jgi:hypothetical protein
VGNRPAAGLRHEGFEADEFVSHPARFGRRMGLTSQPAGAGTRSVESRSRLHPPEQQSAQEEGEENGDILHCLGEEKRTSYLNHAQWRQ